MVLHRGMPALKVWKEFAGSEGLCMSVLLGCDPVSHIRKTNNLRNLSILIDHDIVISRTTRFPNTGREGLRKYEFPSNSAWIRSILRPDNTVRIMDQVFQSVFF